jgi:hypothetical protein
MPEEISGQKNRSVLCQGRIIRAKDTDKLAKEKPQQETETATSFLAASIVDYKFIR